MSKKLSHINEEGNARMVDISDKEITRREAKASCQVIMKKETLKLIMEEKIVKGNVLNVAKTAGILAAKKVQDLIPLCHQLPLEQVDLTFTIDSKKGVIKIISKVVVTAKTGAEMEAMQAVSQAALTIYDMCKAVDKSMIIADIKLLKKTGGKSGTWIRK